MSAIAIAGVLAAAWVGILACAAGWWIESRQRRALYARCLATEAALQIETARRTKEIKCIAQMQIAAKHETDRRIAAEHELATLRARVQPRAADGRYVRSTERNAGGAGSLAQRGT